MDRRAFLRNGALFALSAPCWARLVAPSPAAAGPTPTVDTAKLARVGVTTVAFRSYFAATRTMAAEPNEAPTIGLEEAPAFVLDRVGLRNLEVWDVHFDEQSLAYCERVRNAAERIGSRISNVQVDRIGDLSDADPAQRALAVAQAKEWVDRSAALGAPSFRVNPSRFRSDAVPSPSAFDAAVSGDSYRQIADYAATKNITVLIENHFGISQDVDNVVAILRAAGRTNFRALADYGNSPAATTGERIASVGKLFPYLGFVSAKGTAFDEEMRHIAYDFGALVRATEASGYRGIYSIELWPDANREPPADPIRAALSLKGEVLANLRD